MSSTHLEEQGYLLVEGLLSKVERTHILDEFEKASKQQLVTLPLSLNDSEDISNVVYQSNRSLMCYCYLQSNIVASISRTVENKLAELTRMKWNGNLNATALPIFEYVDGGYIKPHRDRDIGYGKNEYICPIVLTQEGEDFEGGRFFLNKYASVSDDGKDVQEDTSQRIYFKPPMGSGIIFHNPRFIHGTEPVSLSKSGRARRVTASFRSS